MAFLTSSGDLLFEDDVHAVAQMMRDSGFDPVAAAERVKTLLDETRVRAVEDFLEESRDKAERLFDAAEKAGPETMVMMLIAFFVDPRYIMGSMVRFSGPAVLRGMSDGAVTLPRAEKALEDNGGDVVRAALDLGLSPRQVLECWLVGAQARVDEEDGLVLMEPEFGGLRVTACVDDEGGCALRVEGIPAPGTMAALGTFTRFDFGVILESPLSERVAAAGDMADPLPVS